MSYELFLQYILSGITVGSIYAIVAIGFNIIFNTTGIINFAQGEFLMLGGMISITLNTYMPLPLAIIFAVIITGIVGAFIEMVFIRHLLNPSVLRMIIITIGLSIIIRESALHIWDEKVRSLPFFTGTDSSAISIFNARISFQALWVLGISAFIVVILQIFFKWTLYGQSMRACASNKTAAIICGINTKNMITLSFVLSAATGALAGAVISPITNTQYDMGTSLAIKGFTVAILGGLGNSSGAIIAGLLLGIIEALSISVMPLAYRDVISISILLIIICFKPEGLFKN